MNFRGFFFHLLINFILQFYQEKTNFIISNFKQLSIIINFIKEYENDNFGSVNTDFSEPEKIVNMYVYIIGEEIVQDYRDQLDSQEVA